MNELSETDRK